MGSDTLIRGRIAFGPEALSRFTYYRGGGVGAGWRRRSCLTGALNRNAHRLAQRLLGLAHLGGQILKLSSSCLGHCATRPRLPELRDRRAIRTGTRCAAEFFFPFGGYWRDLGRGLSLVGCGHYARGPVPACKRDPSDRSQAGRGLTLLP
jgi:hypothetical protein